MSPLTPVQRAALDAIMADAHAPGVKGVTLDALARRGMILCRQQRDANMNATEFPRWYLTTAGATEQAKRQALTTVGPRSEILIRQPMRPGDGTSRVWTRVLSGKRYSFTAVLMPSGERRYSVSRYDGRPDGRYFSQYWTRLHFVTVPAPSAEVSAPVAEVSATAETAARITAVIDAYTKDAISARRSAAAKEGHRRRRAAHAAAEAHTWLGLTAGQADGTECVRCGVAFSTATGPSLPVGVSDAGSQVFACVRCLTRPVIDADAATAARFILRALDVLVADAALRLAEAEQQRPGERDAHLMIKLFHRHAALVGAYNTARAAAVAVTEVPAAEATPATGEGARLAAALDNVAAESLARREAARIAHHDYGTCDANTRTGPCGRAFDSNGLCDRAAEHAAGGEA